MLRLPRIIGWLLLIVVLFGIGRLYVYVSPDTTQADAYNQLSSLLVYRVLMLAAAIFSASVVAQEVEQKTIVYLVTRPIPRPTLIASRLLATAIVVTGIVVLGAAAVSFATYGPGGISNSYFLRDLKGLAVGALAYSSLFTVTSLLMNRAMIVNLIFAFGWETIATNMTGNIYRLSVFSYLRSIAEKPVSGGGMMGALAGDRSLSYVSAETSWITMAVLIALCAWGCQWWFSRFAYLPREDAE
jgi:ABC-2 type transport system permease protein